MLENLFLKLDSEKSLKRKKKINQLARAKVFCISEKIVAEFYISDSFGSCVGVKRLELSTETAERLASDLFALVLDATQEEKVCKYVFQEKDYNTHTSKIGFCSDCGVLSTSMYYGEECKHCNAGLMMNFSSSNDIVAAFIDCGLDSLALALGVNRHLTQMWKERIRGEYQQLKNKRWSVHQDKQGLWFLQECK